MNKYKLFLFAAVMAWLVFIVYIMVVPVKSECTVEVAPDRAIEVCDSPVVDKPAAMPVSYEDWFRENASVIKDCEITYYCCEKREHICGTGDGITSTGVPVTAGWTCAVDPDVIPYGAEIMVDYGDRVEFWKAQDCGGAIKGNHIDLSVETHAEALLCGTTAANVYWMEVEHEFG